MVTYRKSKSYIEYFEPHYKITIYRHNLNMKNFDFYFMLYWLGVYGGNSKKCDIFIDQSNYLKYKIEQKKCFNDNDWSTPLIEKSIKYFGVYVNLNKN